MATKNKFRTEINLGSFVEDMSGIIGKVIGHGVLVGSVKVEFAKGVERDLFIDKLKLSKYSPAQISAMESEARNMYECLKDILTYVCLGGQRPEQKVIDRITDTLHAIKNKSNSH